jgi:hypothetical protein
MKSSGQVFSVPTLPVLLLFIQKDYSDGFLKNTVLKFDIINPQP